MMKEEDTSMVMADSVAQSPQYPVHVEVRLSHKSLARPAAVKKLVDNMIAAEDGFTVPSNIDFRAHADLVSAGVERVHIAELGAAGPARGAAGAAFDFEKHNSSRWLAARDVALYIHVYQCSERDAADDLAAAGEEGEEIMAATDRNLPAIAWEGLWDSLIYPDDIKMKLLDYIYATVVFSDAGVDHHIVSWNRLVLLHGPPGSGKTSLAQALAQKLSVRLSARYSNARMLEINSHSLFSRWFSESGKLVQKLFAHISDILDEEDTFVVVLIDEVESLTAARAGAVAGSEPSDAVRVVNALLTQIDKLRTRKNVLVMATSNLPNAIDTAFVDRADIVQFVGLPPVAAIYSILRSCLLELMNKSIVRRAEVPPLEAYVNRLQPAGQQLMTVAKLCHAQSMSGRALRRLPILAHMRYIGVTPALLVRSHHVGKTAGSKLNGRDIAGGEETGAGSVSVEQWIDAMTRLVAEQAQQKAHLQLDGVKPEH